MLENPPFDRPFLLWSHWGCIISLVIITGLFISFKSWNTLHSFCPEASCRESETACRFWSVRADRFHRKWHSVKWAQTDIFSLIPVGGYQMCLIFWVDFRKCCFHLPCIPSQRGTCVFLSLLFRSLNNLKVWFAVAINKVSRCMTPSVLKSVQILYDM